MKFLKLTNMKRQNLGVPQWESPSNEDAKIHTFYLCKLDTSQFQDTQANMRKDKI